MAAATGVTAIGVAAAPAFATTSKPVTRLAGGDRIGTAIAISNQEFATAHTARTRRSDRRLYVPGRDECGPTRQALPGPATARSTPGLLDPATLAEIQPRSCQCLRRPRREPPQKRCSPTTPADAVYIVGGDAAIAAVIDTQLNTAGFNVVRLAGTDRFSTSVARWPECEGSPGTVFLATGRIFADALSVGPAAALTGGSVFN